MPRRSPTSSPTPTFDITGRSASTTPPPACRGGPRVSYKDADLDLNFQDDEITRIQTPRASWSPSPWTTRSTPSPAPSPWSSRPSASSRPRGRVHHPRVRETTDRSGALLPTPGPSGVLQTYQVYQPGHRPARRVSLVRPVRWPVRNPFLRTAATSPPGRLTVRTRVRNQRRTAMTRQQSPRREPPSARGHGSRSVEQGAMMAR